MKLDKELKGPGRKKAATPTISEKAAPAVKKEPAPAPPEPVETRAERPVRKDKKPEKSMDRQKVDSPFGDHMPAFMLRGSAVKP